MTIPDVALGSFNLSDPEFWTAPRDVRDGAFRTLRQQSPVSWWEEWEFEGSPFPKGPGYWSVVNHEDVWHVSRNPELFSSGRGVNIGDLPQEITDFFGSMIAMDDPKHFRLRSIVSKGFTPKEINKVEETSRPRPLPSSIGCSPSSPTARATSSTRSPLPCRCRSSAR